MHNRRVRFTSETTATLKSLTNDTNKYSLSIDGSGSPRCSCPAFRFRKGPCKHCIRYAIAHVRKFTGRRMKVAQ